MAKPQLKIRSRLVLVIAIVIVALSSLAWTGIRGLQDERAAVGTLYSNHVLGEQDANELAASLSRAHSLSLELLLDRNHPAEIARVNAEFVAVASNVTNSLATVKADSLDS